MANITFDFMGVSTKDAAHIFSEGKINDIAIAAIPGAELQGTTITIPGYGTLDAANPQKMTLCLSAEAPVAIYSIMNSWEYAGIWTLDASAMTNAFTLGTVSGNALPSLVTGSGNDVVPAVATMTLIDTKAGDDSITLVRHQSISQTVNAGSGSDTIRTSDTLRGATTIDLGAADGSADTFEIGAAAHVPTTEGAVTVNHYNYADGDIIKLDTDTKAMTLNADGTAVIADTAVKVNVVQAGNAYQIRYDDAGTVTEYWRAANGVDSVNFDATGLTADVIIDAAGASSASIASGYGNDQITLSAGTNTLTVGKASGTDTFATNTLSSDDTLILTGGGTIDDLKFAGNDITYVNTSLKGAAAGALTDCKLQVSTDNGKTTKLVHYAFEGTQILNTGTEADKLWEPEDLAATDAAVYLGYGDGSTTGIQSASDVNLWDTDTYKNISAEIVATGAGAYIGAKGKKTYIDASKSAGPVQIWGGSTAANTIYLNKTGETVDTVWFGTTDGTDTVTNFVGGYGTDSDILYLYDTKDLSDLTFDHDGNGAFIMTGKSKISFSSSYETQFNIKLADGTIKKAALPTGYDTVYAVGADVVIGSKTSLIAIYDEAQTDSVLVNLYDTDKYQNIRDVVTKAAKAGAIIIGAEGKRSDIDTGVGTNAVWGGSTDANKITLLANQGTDTVWFGAIDGADTVKNFQTAQDAIKLWDAASTKEIFKNYETSGLADGQFKLQAKANEDNLLTVTSDFKKDANNTIRIADASDKVTKAVVSGTSPTLTFATDASIYYSGAETSAVTVAGSVAGTITAFLDNGGWADAGEYYFGEGVNTFDASASAASTVLIGRAATKSTLRGGLTENAIWGGGYASQDMQGSAAAVDTIWFGTTDGADTFSKGADQGDTIYLWDVSSIDAVKFTMGGATGAETETVVLGGSTLTITDTAHTALDGGLTFKLSTGASYTYDRTNSKFIAKS